MRQSRGAPAKLDGEASHQSDGLAPTSKRRMQRRSPRPADAELTLLELCACPLRQAHGDAELPKQRQVDRLERSSLGQGRRVRGPGILLDRAEVHRRLRDRLEWGEADRLGKRALAGVASALGDLDGYR